MVKGKQEALAVFNPLTAGSAPDDLMEKYTEAYTLLAAGDIQAVSYTHLDVYKRQGQGLPHPHEDDVRHPQGTLALGVGVASGDFTSTQHPGSGDDLLDLSLIHI